METFISSTRPMPTHQYECSSFVHSHIFLFFPIYLSSHRFEMWTKFIFFVHVSMPWWMLIASVNSVSIRRLEALTLASVVNRWIGALRSIQISELSEINFFPLLSSFLFVPGTNPLFNLNLMPRHQQSLTNTQILIIDNLSRCM